MNWDTTGFLKMLGVVLLIQMFIGPFVSPGLLNKIVIIGSFIYGLSGGLVKDEAQDES